MMFRRAFSKAAFRAAALRRAPGQRGMAKWIAGRAEYLVVDPNSGAVSAYLNGGQNPSANLGWVWYPRGTIATGVGEPGSWIQFADLTGDGR